MGLGCRVSGLGGLGLTLWGLGSSMVLSHFEHELTSFFKFRPTKSKF